MRMIGRAGWLANKPSWSFEGPRHGEEQVEVDERAGDREEDLLHDHRPEDARERRGRDQRD